MATLTATITADARKYWPQVFGGIFLPTSEATHTDDVTGLKYWNPVINCFKVGEGGWIDTGSEITYRPPDTNLRRLTGPMVNGQPLQDIDAVVDADRSVGSQRYPSNSRATFTKLLTAADFTWEGPSTLKVRCLLDNNDFNEGAPEIWELGLFSDHPEAKDGDGNALKLMVAYATFPKMVKDQYKQLENVIRITF